MEKWEMIELYPGAHIRVPVHNLYHHGIYIGNDEVVQFGHPFDMYTPSEGIKVIRSPLSDFSTNGFIEVRIYNKKELKKKHSDEEIIQIALSKLGEGEYNILYNNCEHFANYCVFGEKTSEQVDKIHDEVRKMLRSKK